MAAAEEDFGGLASSGGEESEACSAAAGDESPELLCIGCDGSSKPMCPIGARKKEKRRVEWAKTTMRRVRVGGRKKAVKRRCGVTA